MMRRTMVFLTCTVAGLCLAGGTGFGQGRAKPKNEVPVPTRPIKIAPVDDKLAEQVRRSAFLIDRMVEANYKKQGVTPNPVASDEVWVRRAYLVATGTIPEYKHARAFIRSRAGDKDQRLVDELLEDPGYASQMYNYWADLLRLSERITNNVPGRPYIEWVRKCCEENKPYDEFVYEMLAAEGKIWENPAAGYILRDSGMPLDAVNNTVRVFLGTQIGCAQCHDHPFDRWTQKEFYQMAAFTFGTNTRRSAADKMFGGGNVVSRLREELATIDEKYDGGGKYNRFLSGNLMDVHDVNRTLVLPHDYQYEDAAPKSKVEAKTIFDPQPVVKAGETPREAMAKWMTAKENPRFTKTIVNRIWKKTFGVGLIEPEDDMRDDTVASNPELMDFLISEMHRLDFDLKEFQRILYNTKLFRRESTMVEIDLSVPYHFPGPVLRRMTPEQVWDSFITLATMDPNSYQPKPAMIDSTIMNIDMASVSAQEVFDRNNALNESNGYKYRKARDDVYKHEGLLLVRASEQPQPVPPGHFLRQFGQSDRETIQGNFDGGSVPQVLQMFNGPLTHLLLHEKSFLHHNVVSGRSPSDRLETIFLSILNRFPTDEERQVAEDEVRENGPAGYGNVIWSLVNTREFLFVQ
ncbi:DUF1549 and DUF1553 domain-containing protein [Rubinisphaera margarita]|uniref:DUF1549 and DUF1553 domain-containing protein n=1 Tax=Rubinisphaera margarita TaxID=2909586 RepID=UPI001EE9837F|nr:DUF1549 and DUF1553 domain-containing protein [Rubinisphaera margarita]MCG6154914.1 DUF1549 and DUF1553 domain-containing protein [Rubinisphaera margarita]